MKRTGWAILIAFACSSALHAQSSSLPTNDLLTVELTVPQGTPLRVALEKEITVKKAGQAVTGKVVEPVYAYNKIVVPVGSEVSGAITKIDRVPGGQRAQAMLNANFSPPHNVTITFSELTLPDGRKIPLQTVVSPGTVPPVHLMTKEQAGKNAASRTVSQARQQLNQEWQNGMSQIKTAGRFHRAEEYAIAQLPIHPQHIAAGTRYNAELQQPLEFGGETIPAGAMAQVGSAPPNGSLVRVLLMTPLSSATAKKDTQVEAVLSEPLFSAEHQLILPQGSRLEGFVLQAKPARELKRNGDLRIVFRKLELPDGTQSVVEAGLDGVEVGGGDNLQLDAEGGAHAVSPKTRYLSTGIAIALAATSAIPDIDIGPNGTSITANTTGVRAAAGGTGYKLIGIALSVAVHSRPVTMGMGVYGGALSVYEHFLSRGQDVVFPKNTPMDISFGAPGTGPSKVSTTGD